MEGPERHARLSFEFQAGIWIAYLPSQYGPIEVIVDGSDREPKQAHLQALRQFLCAYPEVLTRIRRALKPPFLFRPIRIAVNEANRVGVQFRNKLTGAQTRAFFGDECHD